MSYPQISKQYTSLLFYFKFSLKLNWFHRPSAVCSVHVLPNHRSLDRWLGNTEQNFKKEIQTAKVFTPLSPLRILRQVLISAYLQCFRFHLEIVYSRTIWSKMHFLCILHSGFFGGSAVVTFSSGFDLFYFSFTNRIIQLKFFFVLFLYFSDDWSKKLN